jgi:hypothetical protein
MVDQAATCPFEGIWPRVGEAAVDLRAVANRTIDLYSIDSFAAPRIEISIDGDHLGVGWIRGSSDLAGRRLTTIEPRTRQLSLPA